MCWFQKIELNVNKAQEHFFPEEKVLSLNSGENKFNNKNGKLFQGESNKCGKYGHRASDYWGNSNKVNDNINYNKNIKPRFNRECNNCVKNSTQVC